MAEVETCSAVKHGTEQAWRVGCRCPGALEVHAQRLGRRKAHGPAVDEQGNCIAERHGGQYEFRQFGCRCDSAIAAERARRQRSYRQGARRPYAYRWRGPEQRVSRVSVLLATGGFVEGTTITERWLAARTLLETGHRSGAGLLTPTEVAERLGYSDGGSISVLLGLPDRRRSERIQRRLADVRDKAVRVARAKARRGDTA